MPGHGGQTPPGWNPQAPWSPQNPQGYGAPPPGTWSPGGGQSGGQVQFGGSEPFNNTVHEDPNLQENIGWVRERRSASNVAGQKQRAYGDIDQQAEASGKGIEAMMARRGIGNSGIAIEDQKNNLDAAARAKVRAGMDIDQQEQQRQDNLALNAANIMRAPGQYNLAQQGQNLNQWQAQAGQGNFMAQFAQQQQNAQLDNYMKMMQMFGNVPGGAPTGGGYAGPGGGFGGAGFGSHGGSVLGGSGGGGGGGGLTPFQNPNNRVLGPGGSFPGGRAPWGGVQNDPWFQSYR